MSYFGVSLVSYGCGFATCWMLLVRPARNLLNRWLDFYADDLKAATERQAGVRRASDHELWFQWYLLSRRQKARLIVRRLLRLSRLSAAVPESSEQGHEADRREWREHRGA